MNLNLRIANYITRYAPSRRKLTEYLTKKHCQDIDAKLAEIGYDESITLGAWIRSFVTLGKGEQEIRLKLIKKGFPRQSIEQHIREHTLEIHDWEATTPTIDSNIHTFLARGKSIPSISALLCSKYPYFRDEIKDLLASYSDTDSLQTEVAKYQRKYDTNNPYEKQKLYAALMRK